MSSTILDCAVEDNPTFNKNGSLKVSLSILEKLSDQDLVNLARKKEVTVICDGWRYIVSIVNNELQLRLVF